MFPMQANLNGGWGREAAMPFPYNAGGQHDPARTAPFTEGDSGVHTRRLRVLVVDDAPDVTEMLGMVMRYAGYEVTTALSAPEAFDAARRDRFDVVVSDIGLPRIDGYELLGRLRRLPHLRTVPALALTGYARQRDAEAALAAGFDAHVPKPVDPSALAEQVGRLVVRGARGGQ